MILNKSKYYNDVIYGQLSTTVLANTIIDHKIFQRLRYIIQLGNMQYVFPSCHHSRFEHSIGTYHLCGEYIKTIKENSQTIDFNKPLLNVPFIKNYLYKKYNIENDDFIINNTEKLLDDFLIELIKIGALSHDLGHGPYSHLFDEFLGEQSELMNNPNIHHEHRSNALLKMILETSKIKDMTLLEIITEDGYKFICDLIHPNKKSPTCFIYQIISNKLNGLDVDKLDYLRRDCFYLGKSVPFDYKRIISNAIIINDNIHFSEKINYEIYLVFRTRYDMHKQYYGHKTVISVNLMVKDLLIELNEFLYFKKIFQENNLNKFVDITDSTLLNFTTFYKQLNLPNNIQINKIDEFVNKLKNRNIYKCVYTKTFYENEEINLDLIFEEQKLNKEEHVAKTHFIGLGGNKKLFKNIYFYDKDNNSKIMQNTEISHIISSFSQEKILYIIKKN